MLYLLNNIETSDDVKKLNSADLRELCREIREFLIDSVSKTGGQHLPGDAGAVP